MSREEYAGPIIPMLKLGRSLAPSSRPFWLAHVPSVRDEISVPTHVLACPVGPHNRHGGSQQQQHPYGTLRRPA